MVKKIPLGKNGPAVCPLGYGAMGLSEFYGATNDEEGLQTLNRAIDLGCNFIDTSNMYGNGRNEELIAKVLKTRRSEVFICTKFGIVRDDAGNFVGINGKPEYVKKECQGSLDRLGIDTIDLYYQHRVDPNTPIEDTVRAMADLVKEGKVRYLGLSEASAKTIRRAHAVHPIAAVQVEYSPWTVDIETNDILDTCKELGIAIVAYSPVGRGFLTGEIRSIDDFDKDDYRRRSPRFMGENFNKNLALVDALKAVAAKKGVTVTQLTLAWVLHQYEGMFVIPGTRRVSRLEENFAAIDVKITAEDDKAIRDIIASIPVSGDRYPEAGMRSVNFNPKIYIAIFTMVKTIPLGRNGPLLSPIGYGAMGLSDFYGAADDQESLRTLNRAIDLGCTVLKTRRSEVFICTKFGIVRDDAGNFTGVNGKPEYVKAACQASLERLGIDCIDLYYQHRVDPNTPIEETVRAMADLVKEGKVKYLGLSEATASTIRRAHAVHPISAVQVEYSPWTVEIETNDILNTCKELGIAIVAYSPVGRGFLTGDIKSIDDFAPTDSRRFSPRFMGENFKQNLTLVDALKAVAAKKGVTVTQLTLAWVLHQHEGMFVIPGTRRASRVEENFAAINVNITAEDDRAIRDIIASIPISGDRYPEQYKDLYGYH
ncbi:hypothetical protein HDU97_005382 [Phlyctochytrium planicorne]|nr:hypothetical protein HDU97_005382 [Phlyctochytrium planicorne]